MQHNTQHTINHAMQHEDDTLALAGTDYETMLEKLASDYRSLSECIDNTDLQSA